MHTCARRQMIYFCNDLPNMQNSHSSSDYHNKQKHVPSPQVAARKLSINSLGKSSSLSANLNGPIASTVLKHNTIITLAVRGSRDPLDWLLTISLFQLATSLRFVSVVSRFPNEDEFTINHFCHFQTVSLILPYLVSRT